MKSLYCVNAEHGFCTRPGGSVVPCCIAAGNIIADDGQAASLSKHRAIDLWNSQYLKDLRADLKNGVKNKACKQCWDEEAAGLNSKRLRDNERWKQLTEIPTQSRPKLLDLSLGHTCNLACRTCNAVSSSRWIKEKMRTPLQPVQIAQLKDLSATIKKSYDDEADIWNFLEETIPEVVHIDFYGGEPMLVKKQWELLADISDEQAANISLHFNTNGTQWNDNYADMLTRFKAVIIDISIDGVGEVFEYMRWPAKWDEVNENILNFKRLSDSNPQISLGVCITLSILNIWGLPEAIDYTHKLGITCYLNLLHGPAMMCLKNLPDNARDMVLARLETVEHDQIEGVREFIRENRFDLHLRQDLIKHLMTHDRLRNQNFTTLMPEIYEALKNV